MSESQPLPLALSRYRVLELADEKGLYCGKLLADLGADVIKIERPCGDATRSIGPFKGDDPHPEKSLFFAYYNTNKRGITLNLGHPQGRELLARLVPTADVLLETFQPGYLEGLGLGFAALQELNPRLVLTSITGFGQTGPYRDFLAPDLVAFAMGGLMYLAGDPDKPPVVAPGAQACNLASAHAAFGTLIALFNRGVRGRGEHVGVSLQEVIASADHQIVRYAREADLMRRHGSQSTVAPAGIYPCRDGFVYLFIHSVHHWREFRRWIGDPDALQGEVWEDVRFRRYNIDVINPHILNFTMSRTKGELMAEGQTRHLPVVAVNSVADFAESPQVVARGYFREAEHPVLGQYRTPGAPYQFSLSPWCLRRPAPLIGQHNLEVYSAELGYPAQDVERWRREGAI